MAPSPSTTRAHVIVARATAVVAIVPPAALVVYLVGSLILSGGQVSETTGVKWSVAVPYPLFVMPAVVLIALASASVAAAIAAVLFAGMAPERGVRVGDAVWGAQWNAAPISALAVMILVVGIAVVSRRSPAAGSR
ncbi:hypothetical protein [Microbacterium arborescens]|uniref:hypothetical protein n=1 Tax=Microbacterium arborescens TaxID=33883 RepID=UPI002784D787|nr:hypothetical protein [Microbacterium arborescens]MDQ1215221.1 hypothetical protein [Microbacterium arborescens]